MAAEPGADASSAEAGAVADDASAGCASGAECTDAGARGPADASGSAPPEIVECAAAFPDAVFATARLACGPDGEPALRLVLTVEPHGCDDALEVPRVELIGLGLPAPHEFRAWYEDATYDQGDARFCVGGECRAVGDARWQVEEYVPGGISPAGWAVLCADGGTLVWGAGNARWCGPVVPACR